MNELDDDIKFKPMTEGLGFHKEKEIIFPAIPRRNNNINRRNEKITSSPEFSTDVLKADLGRFYSPPSSDSKTVKVVNENKPVRASRLQTVFAWLIDVSFVLASVSLTLFLFIVVSGIDKENLLTLLRHTEILVFLIILMSSYYLFYFTVLDMSITPGKALLGIKIIGREDIQIKTKHTFIRSLVTLLSPVLFFLPLIMNFHQKLSKTEIINRN